MGAGTTDDATQARLERERHRLVLAASDMRQVWIAADHLAAVPMNADAERVLWTGLVVTYARPFMQSNALGAVSERLARSEDPGLRELHKNMCDRRDDLFAHNDVTELRDVMDAWAELGIGAGHYVERYAPMDAAVLSAISRLAHEQEQRFRDRQNEIEEQLGWSHPTAESLGPLTDQ
jgi:hypothetical protein